MSLDTATILVVEDEKPLLQALVDKLTRERFHVVTARNGAEALKKAAEIKPDVILLDILMPRMDGMTMLKKLRGQSTWGKQVPVIILTNVEPDEDALMQDVAATQPTYYIVKANMNIDGLVSKVRDALKRE